MIDALITGLSKGLELSAEEIADTLWLALQIEESQPELSVRAELRENPPQPPFPRGEPEILPEIQETLPSEREETASNQPPDEPKAGIYPRNPQESLVGSGLSLRVPDAPSLREPLTLARALKPLMRRMPSGSTLVLDEAATTQQIAETGLWLPVLKPTLEPWLDLELVVDEGISMQIWRHTIGELERLLKNYGIFRDVRVWGLIADDSESSDLPRLVQIRRGIGATAKNQSPRSPAELIDPSGRRLILVVSDCVSPQWRDGKLTKTLELWAKQGSMAIVQMLPKWLWKRTALGRDSEVRLQGLNPGEFNQKLIAKGVSLWDELEETRGVKVPIFTLEPERVATWAQMLSGKGSTWTAGYMFKLDPLPVRQGRDLFNLDIDRSNPEQRVQAFRVTASPMARKLAGLLAAAPVISLPIVRLIQETLLKESQQVHVAEVFLGGLLKPLSEINPETNPNYVQYEFMDGVRELLADSVPSGYQGNIFDAVSKYMARKMGLSLEEFAAVLRNPHQVLDGEMASEVGYFATMTPQILRQLGGEYVKFAEELERNHRQRYQNNSQATLNPLPDIEYRAGGSLHPDLSSYVKRKADDKLYNAVKAGQLCIVSTPRQTGKSSLMSQTIRRLQEEEFACALIDISTIVASDLTQEQWYAGLIFKIARYFELREEFDLKIWWQQLSHLSPAYRFIEFIEEILLQRISQRIIIFIDEFDATLILDFKQDFFAILRGLHQIRSQGKDLNRLNFVLAGVFLDTNITLDINTSPLSNIATKIDLESFSYEEALPLAGGLAEKVNNPQELLREILAWTGGQPFLTQKICLLVKESDTYVPAGNEKAWLDNLVMTKVIDRWQEQDNPQHLQTIQDRIFYEDSNESLKLYRAILQEDEHFSAKSKVVEELILTGLVVRSKAKLKIANKIYSAIFNSEWIEESLGNSINSMLQIDANTGIKQILDRKRNPNLKQLLNRLRKGGNNRKNKSSDNVIQIIGGRGSGKTTFLAALAALPYSSSSTGINSITSVNNQLASQELMEHAKYLLEQGLGFKANSSLFDSNQYSLNISLKNYSKMAGLRMRSIQSTVTDKKYEGDFYTDLVEQLNNIRLQDYLDDCIKATGILLLVDGSNGRRDEEYAIGLEFFLNALNKSTDSQQKKRIAFVVNKCELPEIWLQRSDPRRLSRRFFPKMVEELEAWQDHNLGYVDYFTSSAFGVIGRNYPEANTTILRRDNTHTSIIKKPRLWKPIGLVSPIYWLCTGLRHKELDNIKIE
jgi:AAA-like domain